MAMSRARRGLGQRRAVDAAGPVTVADSSPAAVSLDRRGRRPAFTGRTRDRGGIPSSPLLGSGRRPGPIIAGAQLGA